MRTYLAHRPGVEVRDPFAGVQVPAFLQGKERATCADHDPELWFPNSRISEWVQAQRICYRCPLIAGCREWALEHGEAGVWGGLTEYKRTRIRNQREATA